MTAEDFPSALLSAFWPSVLLPAALLAGLGTPWNTMQIGGTLRRQRDEGWGVRVYLAEVDAVRLPPPPPGPAERG